MKESSSASVTFISMLFLPIGPPPLEIPLQAADVPAFGHFAAALGESRREIAAMPRSELRETYDTSRKPTAIP